MNPNGQIPECGDAPLPVINSNVFSNPYQGLLYSALDGRYRRERGGPADALAALRRDGKGIFHIHWEESVIIHCGTRHEARRARICYARDLAEYRRAGGRIVWTVHNLLPHELGYVETFKTFRRQLAGLADRILVHDVHSIGAIERQVGALDRAKLRVLPHPSYLGCYEPAQESLRRHGAPAHPSTVLCFGRIRAYKGVADLLRKLPPAFTERHGIRIDIRGQPLRADEEVREIQALAAGRPDVAYSLRRVASAELPAMLRSCGALVLPYTRFLTSGVAVLGLSVGVPVVAPDTPQMRELLPQAGHALLFRPRSVRDLRRAILHALRLSAAERAAIARQSLRRAVARGPEAVSLRLGAIYDELLR